MQIKYDINAPTIQPEIAEIRLNMCKSCEHFTNDHICPLSNTNIIVNVVFEDETCPLNKW